MSDDKSMTLYCPTWGAWVHVLTDKALYFYVQLPTKEAATAILTYAIRDPNPCTLLDAYVYKIPTLAEWNSTKWFKNPGVDYPFPGFKGLVNVKTIHTAKGYFTLAELEKFNNGLPDDKHEFPLDEEELKRIKSAGVKWIENQTLDTAEKQLLRRAYDAIKPRFVQSIQRFDFLLFMNSNDNLSSALKVIAAIFQKKKKLPLYQDLKEVPADDDEKEEDLDKIELLKAKLKTAEETVTQQQSTITELSENMQQVLEANVQLELELGEYKEENETSAGKLRHVRKELATTNALFDENVDELANAKGDIITLGHQLQAKDIDLADATNNLVNANESVITLREKVQAKDIELANAMDELDNATDKLATAEETVTQQQSIITELSENMQQVLEANVQLELELGEYKEENETSAGKLRHVRKELATTNALFDENVDELANAKGDIITLGHQLQAKDIDLADATNKLVNANESVITLREKVQTKDIELANAMDELDNATDKLATAKDEVANAKELMGISTAEIAHLESLVGAKDIDLATATGELATATGELANANGRIGSLVEEIANLESNLDTANADLDILRWLGRRL